jgi:hypothetical protein
MRGQEMKRPESQPSTSYDASRRSFLKAVGTLSAAAAGLPQDARGAEQQKLPQVRIGKYSISRLICGSNTFGGLSHLSAMINREMRQYFTPEQVAKTYRRCAEVGINTFEPLRDEPYKRLTEAGIQIQGFARGRGDPEGIKAIAQRGGIIGIHHNGTSTDPLFKQGQLGVVRDYTKRLRDTGLLVGVTSHIPEVIAEIESQGWDLDYYMTCVYQWGRTKEEFEKLAGDRKELLPIETYTVIAREGYSEVFLSGDPPKMFKVIRQVKKPCLVYKILAAGRRCETAQTVEAAFKEAFENIKPTDAIIVGMYDRYSDQAAENAELVRKYGTVA